jgi:DNA-binding response OmpR family regulator
MRVLLAEDEITIAVTLRDALEAAGHTVLAAPDTPTAMKILEKDAPEAVLTDIRMPGDGGMAVLKRSLDLDPSRPVLVLTGYATVDQAVEAMSLGARNYVQKPFRNEAIVRMVDTFARVRLLEAENARLRADLGEARERPEDRLGGLQPQGLTRADRLRERELRFGGEDHLRACAAEVSGRRRAGSGHWRGVLFPEGQDWGEQESGEWRGNGSNGWRPRGKNYRRCKRRRKKRKKL